MVKRVGVFNFFDPAKFDEQTLGIDDVKREVKSVFLEKTPEILTSIENAAQQGDSTSLGKLLHKLKASVSILCYPTFREEVIFLEKYAEDLPNEEYAQRLRQMVENLQILMEEFESFSID